MNNDPLILGRTNWREPYRRRLFGLRAGDRLQHVYIIGQTGTGKTTLMANLMWQDLKLGRGFAFLDPHGDAVERLVAQIPSDRRASVIYLDVPNPDCEFGFNPLESVALEQRAFAASGIIEAFRSVWGTTWGPRLEHILRNALLTLLDQPEATLADISRLFTDDAYLKACLPQITHPTNLEFWTREFAKYPYRYRVEAIAPVQNKLGAFLAQPPLFRLLTRPRSGYNLRQVFDERGVLLVNLAKGRIGGDGAALLGSLIVSRLGLVGLSRQDLPEEARVPFFIYLDEFHTFTTTALSGMLSELRKYRLGLVLAHQFSAQLETEVRDAVFGNVGTLIVFRVGPDDARVLHRQFSPEFQELDLVNLPDHDIYVRLLVQGAPARPFSATTLPPLWTQTCSESSHG
ncbi:MAG: hypothetical protein HMLKMBBP_01681 [Planctomycetes bacterium]|nr:hypothetical protein [Planctomycetota bacterium]